MTLVSNCLSGRNRHIEQVPKSRSSNQKAHEPRTVLVLGLTGELRQSDDLAE